MSLKTNNLELEGTLFDQSSVPGGGPETDPGAGPGTDPGAGPGGNSVGDQSPDIGSSNSCKLLF